MSEDDVRIKYFIGHLNSAYICSSLTSMATQTSVHTFIYGPSLVQQHRSPRGINPCSQ
jgi:hypothetical protein